MKYLWNKSKEREFKKHLNNPSSIKATENKQNKLITFHKPQTH